MRLYMFSFQASYGTFGIEAYLLDNLTFEKVEHTHARSAGAICKSLPVTLNLAFPCLDPCVHVWERRVCGSPHRPRSWRASNRTRAVRIAKLRMPSEFYAFKIRQLAYEH